MSEIHLGDEDIPIVDAILLLILILSLIFNSYLFHRGQGNYSIKYQLMRNQEFFRSNMNVTYIIEFMYRSFFVLPFLLLIALSILTALRSVSTLPATLINGLIIILILYPTKYEHFYYRLLWIWILATASQLSTFFINKFSNDIIYYILSSIFYTGNIFFFYLSLLSIQKIYWQIQQGIKQIKNEIQEFNNKWSIGMIPKLFDGGIYGYFCKNKYRYFLFILLYIVSLVILGVYAFLVYVVLNSNLGIVGLVSAIIYDIFVQIFNSLSHKGRSLKSVYIVLVASRFLSFIFGITNWLLGYCVLYFFVSIFIGWIIIDKYFPLKQYNSNKEGIRRRFTNALKTPEFALFALTVEIVIMIVVQAYALEHDAKLTYNNVNIPTWQWGILAVIGAWVVIAYLLSVRVLLRQRRRIFSQTSYYFGISQIKQYHIYLTTSYILLICLGLYGDVYLKQQLILICCIFLPLIYFCILGFWIAWNNNQYMLLADIDQYNQISQKKYQIKVKKAELVSMNQKLKAKKKQMMVNTFHKGIKSSQNLISGFKHFVGMIGIGSNVQQQRQQSINLGQQSDGNIRPREIDQRSKNYIKNQSTVEVFIPLKNWRNIQQNITYTQMWKCLTPNDKKIIMYTIAFIIISIGYCLTSMLWAGDKFGISLIVCLIPYLTLIPYYKFYKTKGKMLDAEIIGNWVGFLIGIAYWAVFNGEVVGPIAYSICYMFIALFLLIHCYRTELNFRVLLSPTLQIFLCITFIQITLSKNTNVILSVVFGLIFFILIVLQIPVYYKLVHEYIPKYIIGICIVLICVVVIGLSILGYIKNVLSSFAIFSIVMALISISFFLTSVVIYVNRKIQQQQNPNIYSAYGAEHYRFDSSKQKLKHNDIHLIIFSIAMTTLVIYAAIISVFFNNKQWSIYALSLFWLLQLLVNVQVAISCYIFIGEYKKSKNLSKQLILESFLKIKNEYMVEQYENKDTQQLQKQYKRLQQQAQKTNDSADWKQVLTCHDVLIKNIKDQQIFLIYWIGLIMFNLKAKQKQLMFKILAQLQQIQQQLLESGIILQSLSSTLTPQQKYQQIMLELDNLQPLDFIIYQQILEKHRADNLVKQQQIQEMHERQKRQIQKRNQQLYYEIQKRQLTDKQNQILKFQKMVKNLGKKNLFFDVQFPANQTILGENLNNEVNTWRRPNIGQVLTKTQKLSSDEVRQGKIGDCYLISSFGVLGHQRIKQTLGIDSEGNQKWTNTKGAFMVRFYKFGMQLFVIIDDLLPVNQNDEWVFAKSQDPTQYWPCILQKAYAKLYGGYSKIIQGKCHQVMSQFTGGFPFEIVLDDYKSNPNGLWNQIITSKKNGYLLASGSPPNIQGDLVSSKRGIVQGHAYSILDARQVDQYKLLKLKNPHGSLGKQWNGDFSDKSQLMTKRMLGLLDHVRQNDGIFWISIEDFLIQFKSLYICAVFDQRWLKIGPINGQWTDNNSFGTPNFPGAENNPHYGLQVTKKCTMFISLTQDAVSALKGKNFIFMKAISNKGKRITPQSITPQNTIGKPKKPIDAVTISLELQLQAQSYPYVFSLMVCCDSPGKIGKYTLQAYCDDKKAKIIADSEFDKKK